jgi:hypothetical protein
MKWYHDATGSISSMRIMAMISTVTGCAAVASAVVGFFLQNPQAVMLATVGAGMAGLGEVSKAWQASHGR